ncbi:MAG: flagellar motor switch protein FliN [Balneolaceae bacterium]|nr:flagellar motor switch protein FliN [Balneolaceae bacterium]
MINYQEKLESYLPDLEKFLTSVLLEETDIEIISNEMVEVDPFIERMEKVDIFIYSRDKISGVDVIYILDKAWFAILSSIMLGVDESSFNEVTKDLLKKFSVELSATLQKRLKEDDVEVDLERIEVLTLDQLDEKLTHSEYYFGLMEVEGLADNKIRAAALLGNPDAVREYEEEEDEAEENTKGEEFSPTDSEEMEKMGAEQEVVSGRYIEFEEFNEGSSELVNEEGKSMDLLKDVEMNVSVELGRIELPLGKVLQLAKGSVIELEKLAGEPVDILVNGQRIAHGEVVVIDEHFGVRISNLITTRHRIANLN